MTRGLQAQALLCVAVAVAAAESDDKIFSDDGDEDGAGPSGGGSAGAPGMAAGSEGGGPSGLSIDLRAAQAIVDPIGGWVRACMYVCGAVRAERAQCVLTAEAWAQNDPWQGGGHDARTHAFDAVGERRGIWPADA